LKSNEIVLEFHFDELNMRLSLDDREEFLGLLKLRYSNLCPNIRLRIFGIPEVSLKEYRG
jgi:hypothetical protein